MHLYSTICRYARQQDGCTDTTMKTPKRSTLTLTALVAPISIGGFPTFRADELHTLKESVCFHIEADRIPNDIRCECLQEGRFCLHAEHWLLEFGHDSLFWPSKDGKPHPGSLIRYTGLKKGGKSVVIGDFDERICCVEGLGKFGENEGGSSMRTG
ncbi:hypothetical protein OPT61_g2674 [Boeremia exigua]|uniref:Uncharacterized protein n=1 Tax=Boeremia exigua TaxID=749465 RepID=A0ACC2IKL2_9PLEO|nr:hypothetical protein OPT61_g2674 [Boeremia exigua]